MFRKTWKTIKILLIIVVILICVPHSIFPKKESEGQKHELKSQQKEQSFIGSKTSVSDSIPKGSSQSNLNRAK
jgi:regulatory protein YycI of two-component signal transduction system YycFG